MLYSIIGGTMPKITAAYSAADLNTETAAVAKVQRTLDRGGDWLAVDQAARESGYSYWTLKSAIDAGRLPALKIAGRVFVRRSAIEAGVGLTTRAGRTIKRPRVPKNQPALI